MYKPSLRNRLLRSPSPLYSKTPTKNFLQVPKNSLVYYKKFKKSKSPSKASSSFLALKESSPQRPTFVIKNDLTNVVSYKNLFPHFKAEDSLVKINTEKIIKQLAQEAGLNSKSTTKLLVKFHKFYDKRPTESPLPKLSTQLRSFNRQFNHVSPEKIQRTLKKHKKSSLGDGGLCGWETGSNKNN